MEQKNPFSFDKEQVKNSRITSLQMENGHKQFGRSISLYSKTQEWKKSGKNRFVFGPQPNHNFGPKASLSPGMPDDDTQPAFNLASSIIRLLKWRTP